MRDTFSQLRRSAYELGSSSSPADDTFGLRIKTPRVPSSAQAQVHSREVTLLENGMIVEHVDLRKEEREERDKKRRSERREKRDLSRVRKSSRSSRSAADVASVYSVPLASPLPQADSGFFSNPRDSRYSQSFSPRPNSVLAIGGDRPVTMLRAQSQASFSEVQSIGSAPSPRRSRFFGFKNLSSAWHSRDSVAPSGSMIDMQCVLLSPCAIISLTNVLHVQPGPAARAAILCCTSFGGRHQQQYANLAGITVLATGGHFFRACCPSSTHIDKEEDRPEKDLEARHRLLQGQREGRWSISFYR